MKQKQFYLIFILLTVWLICPLKLLAQEYNISYKNQGLEEVITDLRKKTGYEFMYQKKIIQDLPAITCTLKNVSLTQILDRIFYQAELDYEIVKKTIILSKPKKELNSFKKLITGVVLDENGQTLPGASILLVGTTSGAATDLDGAFSLFVEGKNPYIHVSYIGMQDQDIRVNSQKENFFVITLRQDVKLMEEVVVTGYQNIKRENATGAYQSVSAKEMSNRYSGTIVSNLEGKIPGLVSYNNGLNDGGESALSIRGAGSFQAKTNPLVVVDGLPIEGSIETVNPYEIENLTILKDASAAAIYGARASNGVIVITTKKAHSEKMSIDFSSDFTISEKRDYDHYHWANAAEMIELEKFNFDNMRNAASQTSFDALLGKYNTNRRVVSPINRLLVANYLGEINTQELNNKLDRLSRNNYRKEWQDTWERNRVLQQYNLAIRTKGKVLASSIVLNYKNDNSGVVKESNNSLTFSYRGNLKAAKWLDISFGTNVISERAKLHINNALGYNGINAFQPYQSMFNEDGSRAGMEADVYLGEESLKNPEYGFKPVTYNLLDEVNMNFDKTRRTNIRSFAHANVKILPEWKVSAQFQYEDIYYKSDAYQEGNSYSMRNLYNLYTKEETVTEMDWETEEMVTRNVVKHHIPEGGMLKTNTSEGGFYTFRAQTDYSKVFAKKHEVEAMAGFEFRESNSKTYSNLLMGYDEQSQTNNNGLLNFAAWQDLEGTSSALGPEYYIIGAPTSEDFITSNELHRFYSIYFTGNYTYDRRYSASFSYRVDKTDLFGADPKFRGRPLWSAGLSWNAHNESFMKQYQWIDMLKVRMSYGLTGNIDQTVSSYLTATIGTNEVNGGKVANLDTPPNDQLRWEKTTSWNAGVDFSFWNNRLSGSFDWYRKEGSDLLAVTDLDPTSGWNQLTINNGKALNTGVELQLNGSILQAVTRNSFGVNASLNFSYNKNKVTKVTHQPASGYEALSSHTLHEGYPIHSLFSYRFAGMVNEDGYQYFSWKGADGNVHTSDVSGGEFAVEDAVFSGALDPKYVGSFTPEVTYGGFSLSAMFSYYGGHYMRARTDEWTSYGSQYGYDRTDIDGIPRSYLNYWRNDNKDLYPANGYLGGNNVVGDSQYMDINVVPADYIKFRNLVLGYNFSRTICKRMGVNALRLRVQLNNLATWKRNTLGVDPEANDPVSGTTQQKTPRSYTMSLYINF